jgi:membrane protease YdiL (CAAX protease family)
LDGKGWPRSTSEARHRSLRARPVDGRVFAWALIAGTLSIIALTGFWIVLFQLVKIPGNTLPDFSQYPRLTIVLVLLMAAIVGGVSEEAGFRGYFQGLLEQELGGPAAIIIASLVLAPGHALSQGFVWPTLLFYFFVDVSFGVTAYLTQSIIPSILIHSVGLLTFFTLVWPNDTARRLHGDGTWFWLHAAQAVVFSVLTILAFRKLSAITRQARAK